MKKTYFKPQIKVVKLHGRRPFLLNSQTAPAPVSRSKTNLEEIDDIGYGGSSENDGIGYAR